MQVYGDTSPRPNIPDLRGKLFRTRNLEGGSLPPSRHALFQHCPRVNAVCMRDKSYTEKCPQLPVYADCGFKIVGFSQLTYNTDNMGKGNTEGNGRK